ncbi:MAG: VCBS repeat-containing protein, partial [Methanobacteriota archaeon]
MLFAGLVTLAIFRYITPYQFSTVKGIQRSKPIFFKFDFYDLDKNGVEERLEFGNNTRGNRYFVKVNRDYRRGLIDQFNFQAPIIDDGFSRGYYDLNGDGVDEVFVFSNDNDYLYLSVIDIQQIKFLVKEKPILASSPQRAQQEWDISYLYPKFSDLDGDGKPELLFNVNSGYARLPRCLCVLDLQTMEVVKRFDHHMGAVNFEVMDLDQDGKKEIALGCSATNNFSNQPDVFLSDAYSWLVLLDYRLNLLRKPFRIGEKFSGVSVYPVPAKPKPFFLAPTILNKDFRLYVINSQGEISQKDTQHLSLTTGYYIYYQNSLPFIVCSTKDKLLIEYDHHLNITRKFDLPEKILANVLTVEDVLGDGKNEYFLKNVKGIYLLDDEGNTLAFYPTDFDLKRTQFHLVHSPGSRIPQVVLTPPSEVIELSLESSPLYGKLTLIFPGLLVIFYLLLMLGHLSLNKLHQYISFFLFSLRSSDNAIILLNHNGKVLSVNQ